MRLSRMKVTNKQCFSYGISIEIDGQTADLTQNPRN